MKTKVLLLVCLLPYVLFSQQLILEEGFESGVIPTGWTNLDKDGDAELWEMHPSDWSAPHTGDYSVASYSWFNGNPFTPNNWLITPKLTLEGGGELSYWVSPISENYNQEHYYVLISNNQEFNSEGTDTLVDEIIPQNQTGWEIREISLAEYSGQEIYIAFVHADITDVFALKLDDIKVVTDEVSVLNKDVDVFSIYPNPTANELRISGITNDIKVSIYSLTGQLLLQDVTKNKSINITCLAAGPYIVSAYIQNYRFNKTFIIEK